MTELKWRKSTKSGSVQQCVEVALLPDATLVRDSKNPHGAHLSITRDRWHSFLTQLKTEQH